MKSSFKHLAIHSISVVGRQLSSYLKKAGNAFQSERERECYFSKMTLWRAYCLVASPSLFCLHLPHLNFSLTLLLKLNCPPWEAKFILPLYLPHPLWFSFWFSRFCNSKIKLESLYFLQDCSFFLDLKDLSFSELLLKLLHSCYTIINDRLLFLFSISYNFASVAFIAADVAERARGL